MNAELKHPIILFDGVCNLCIGSVQFIIKRETKKYFRFASLQSAFAKKILHQYNLNENNFSSFILLENGKIFTQSTAVLKIIKDLYGAWKLMYAFIIIPSFIRNFIYNFIANNRYKWFGKTNECWIPNKELMSLFIE